jgi:hypothetical protein
MATLVLFICIAAPISEITGQRIVRAGDKWFSEHVQSVLIHFQLLIMQGPVKQFRQ